jgi:tetratricopeptide (TPR) repeat protein
MRFTLYLAVAAAAFAQSSDPAERAYAALLARDYETAIAAFLAAPSKPNIRKDLAYTYLKIGEPERARDQFHEALLLDPADTNAALEYAFLCYETKQQAEARRVFDRIRKTGNQIAEQAFHNIDDPLAAGIDRWQKAIELGADNFSAHYELATLAEQRDELALAATHYERAWRILPDRRTVLVDLGRVWKGMGRTDDSTAALIAASRGGEPRAAEQARELLSAHYPFVGEFRRALELDPANYELQRELGFLLLRMGRQPEAEAEFRQLTLLAPEDLLSATQLGFLLYARGEQAAAMPLFDRVLAGGDEDLANRVRAVLRMPQTLRPRASAAAPSIDAKVMADRSIKAGYLKDALKYLDVAHESDPADFDVMLKLAWTNNLLHHDAIAFHWFELARLSPDPKIAADAARGFRNLRPSIQRFRTSLWLFPVFSTRWHDLFSYSQLKTEFNPGIPVRPYVSLRFVGDSRGTIGSASPQYLSESSFILAVGASSVPWHSLTLWGEAGTSISYVKGRMLPDYRAGLAGSRSFRREGSRWNAAANLDALYVSRFDHDFLIYTQTRAGYGWVYWNANATLDARRQDWANFVETGPGLRIPLPQSMYMTFNALRGRYLIDNPSRRATFNDLRAGFWYAISH